MKKLFFVTGELSGDTHAASLLNELYKIIAPGQLIIKAIGGSHLKEAGAEIFFDSQHLGSMGLTEVISNLVLYLKLEKELMLELSTFNPDVLILIDFPGFNLRIAKLVKKKLPHIKIVYYLPPQVWAWNEGRTKTLAKCCDLVLCGLPFEEEFHRKRGVNAYYIGSPILHELKEYNREKIRSEFAVTKEDTLIGLFPGSRNSEIHHMLPVLLKACEMLYSVFPNYRFMIAQASTISNLDIEVNNYLDKNNMKRLKEKMKLLPPGNNHKLLCASDFTWLTSGTVTLEAALYETPMILGYKGNPINYFLYLLLKRINMIGLPNIIYGEKIVPELIQNEATSENYYQITKEWLHVAGKLQIIKKNLKKVKEKLTDKDANKEAALKIKNEFMPDYKVLTLK
ncbi:MAG: lipid-A-disaccharide synthase [Candidatus Melainabacteria bacterium RIFCSPHIGHO2_02_FULL_34_12]|nr:MAG: lipid-A-disaccharide synthase [Candidatus Melainabacteria bacterium RIFCSPHIGHO2_02_FULL_34_12]